MAQPIDPLIIWATDDVVLPNSGQQNKIRPQDSLIATGWDKSQKPAAEEFNYLINNLALWIEYYGAEKFLDYYTKLEVDSKTITAGNGLTGGGELGTNPTLDIGTPSTVGGSSSNTTTADSHTHALALDTNNISILTGTVSHGGTIPLPAGYTQAQCKWLVSMSNDNPSNTTWDLDESILAVHYKSICSADANRVVTAQTFVFDDATGTTVTINSTVNYIIVGVK